MNVPSELRPAFEALLRAPLEESNPLRDDVASYRQALHQAVSEDRLELDLALVDAITDSLENMLKRVSRKTTPLHHRLIHATARICIQGPDAGRPLDDARLRVDVAVINECARVIRRPEVAISTKN